MSADDYTRRDVIRKGATASGIVALGSLAGCTGDDGNGNGNGNGDGTPTDGTETTTDGTQTTTTDDGDGTVGGVTPGEIVPARAGAVVSMDAEAMLNDDDLKGIINTAIEQLRALDEEGDLPEDVDSAIAMAQEESDLDPTEFDQGLLFMEVAEAGTGGDYVGIVMETDWSETELVEFIESENDESLQQSEYGGRTIYSSGTNEEGGLAVLADGRYVLGPTNVLEDTIDVANGGADAVSGDFAATYDGTTDGHVEFAFGVPENAFEEEEFEDIDTENLKAVEYISGSVYKAGSAYGIEVNMRTDSAETASDLQDDMDAILDAYLLSEDPPEEVQTAVENIELTTDGSTMTMSYEEDIERIDTFVEENLLQLLFQLAGNADTEI